MTNQTPKKKRKKLNNKNEMKHASAVQPVQSGPIILR